MRVQSRVSGTSWRRGPLAAIAGAAALIGTVVAVHYASLGLTLSHYDARPSPSSLAESPTVSRRDGSRLALSGSRFAPPAERAARGSTSSIRTGASAVAISVLVRHLPPRPRTWIVRRLTRCVERRPRGSRRVSPLNPEHALSAGDAADEPLLIALTVVSIALLLWRIAMRLLTRVPSPDRINTGALTPSATRWSAGRLRWRALTRYEAWPVTIGGLAATIWVLWRRGVSPANADALDGRCRGVSRRGDRRLHDLQPGRRRGVVRQRLLRPRNPARGPIRDVGQSHRLGTPRTGRTLDSPSRSRRHARRSRTVLSAAAPPAILPLALLGTAAVPVRLSTDRRSPASAT